MQWCHHSTANEFTLFRRKFVQKYFYSVLYTAATLVKIQKLRLQFNPLKTKRRPLYLKTQFVPRSKQLSSRL
jgi:hypothetical protein